MKQHTVEVIVKGEVQGVEGMEGKAMVLHMASEYGDTPITGVEVGVYLGDHALTLLTRLNMEKLYLVDPYLNYDEYDDGPAEYLDEAKVEAYEKLSGYKNIEWIHETSEDAISKLPDEVDFVYLDANHEYKYISADIKMYHPIVKSGGFFGGHDYIDAVEPEHKKTGHKGVQKAVHEFLIKEKYTELYISSGHWPDWYVRKR